MFRKHLRRYGFFLMRRPRTKMHGGLCSLTSGSAAALWFPVVPGVAFAAPLYAPQAGTGKRRRSPNTSSHHVCDSCRRSKVRCEKDKPCRRCIKAGWGDTCVSWRTAKAPTCARPTVAAPPGSSTAGELDDPPRLDHMIQEEERSGADGSAPTNANLLDLEPYAFTAGKCFEDSEVGLDLCAPGGGGDGVASPSVASLQD